MSANDPKRTLGLWFPEPLTGLCSGISFVAHEVCQIAVAEFAELAAFTDAAPPFGNALTKRPRDLAQLKSSGGSGEIDQDVTLRGHRPPAFAPP
jgi:hypothetical protein